MILVVILPFGSEMDLDRCVSMIKIITLKWLSLAFGSRSGKLGYFTDSDRLAHLPIAIRKMNLILDRDQRILQSFYRKYDRNCRK